MNNPAESAPKRRPTLRDWCDASRPQYYIATLIPLVLGFVLAGRDTGIWRFSTFMLVLLASFLIHLATNLANDVFDFESGVDNEASIGGSLALREGRISRRDYRIALALLYGISILIAPFVIIPSGEPVLWLFGGVAVFSSIYYTAPPFRFGYRAMGEALVFLNMGVIMVCGAYMACAREFRLYTLAFGIIVGFMVASILYFQSLPEIETDGAAGKRTLAVRLGMERAFLLYRIWWPGIWLLITMLWLTGSVAWPALGWVLALPFYARTMRALSDATPETLLELDSRGFLTRLMYLVTGTALILGVIPAS